MGNKDTDELTRLVVSLGLVILARSFGIDYDALAAPKRQTKRQRRAAKRAVAAVPGRQDRVVRDLGDAEVVE